MQCTKDMIASINQLDFYLVYKSKSYKLEENHENSYKISCISIANNPKELTI